MPGGVINSENFLTKKGGIYEIRDGMFNKNRGDRSYNMRFGQGNGFLSWSKTMEHPPVDRDTD